MKVLPMDLNNTATFARRGIVISIILLVLSIIGFISYQIYKNYQIAHTPPPEEKINLGYGELSPPDFPQSLTPSDQYDYSVDTTTGGLPNFGNTIRVYFIPKPFATLLAAEKSAGLAAKFEIEALPQILNDTKYQYTSDDRQITIEIDTNNFTYSQTFLEEADQGAVEEDNQLIQSFKDTLSSRNLLNDNLREGRTKVVLVSFDEQGQITPVTSRSEAMGAIISIWPSDLDQKPIVNPDFNKSLINAVTQVTAVGLENYRQINYTYWQIDTNNFSVYPLKKVDQALEELKNGEGVVVINPPKNQVSISSVYLAYYLPEIIDWQSPYLQPIYVFEGPSFAAYVSAIGQVVPSASP
jgi:hypothetical protein